MTTITYTTRQPLETEPQDDVVAAFATREAFDASRRVSPVDFTVALRNEQAQHAHPTQDWTELCLKLCRVVYDIPSLASSAYNAWLIADSSDKHAGGSPDGAPTGSILIFKGSGPNGHAMVAARPFHDGDHAAWSNDLVITGKVNKVHRTAPITVWGQRYLGFLTELNGYELDLTHGKPPKPKEKPYPAIEKAIKRLQAAEHTAQVHHDKADVKAIQADLKRLQTLYKTLRKA